MSDHKRKPAVVPRNSHSSDDERRQFLVSATAATGVVGAALAAWPFIASMQTSERANANGGPVTVTLSELELGQQVSVLWRGQPVWVLRRTTEMLERMTGPRWLDELRDPDSRVASQQPAYAQNSSRSIRPDYFVAIGICTHLGCVPTFRPDVGGTELGENWVGGFFCPCHGSRFDLAGRVTKNVPAPTNLVVPPHRFVDGGTVEIGVDHAAA